MGFGHDITDTASDIGFDAADRCQEANSGVLEEGQISVVPHMPRVVDVSDPNNDGCLEQVSHASPLPES